jgi:hypothetical protein
MSDLIEQFLLAAIAVWSWGSDYRHSPGFQIEYVGQDDDGFIIHWSTA